MDSCPIKILQFRSRSSVELLFDVVVEGMTSKEVEFEADDTDAHDPKQDLWDPLWVRLRLRLIVFEVESSVIV